MHLVPADRQDRRTIDDHQVCAAIAGIGDADRVHRQAERFALLGDPSRLTLLLAIDAAADISVTDLAIAAGMSDTAVSQALRLLRTAGIVSGRKDGRVVRYRLADAQTALLLRDVRDRLTAAAPAQR